MSWIRHLGLSAAATFLAATTNAQLVYVDQDATGADDGSSWNDAYTDLKVALLFAPADSELRLAEGTYLPDQGSGLRSATFGISRSLQLLGGHAGVGAPDPDLRDITGTPTILSGDLLGDDAPDFANRADNTYHVVTVQAAGATVLLDGLTVRGGYADLAPSDDDGGGVLRLDGDVTLANCTLTDNHARDEGGGGWAITLATGCLVTGNRCEQRGGGLHARAISDSVFTGNQSHRFGAGVYVTEGSLSDSDFMGNVIVSSSASSGGAGAYVGGSDGALVSDCVFDGNTVEGDGRGAGLICAPLGSGTVEGCLLTGNLITGDGRGAGAVGNAEFDTRFVDCRILGNRVEGPNGVGGGVEGGSTDPSLSLERCVLSGNHTGDVGGAVYATFDADIDSCTIVANTCGGPGGAGVYNTNCADEGVVAIRESILYGNSAAGATDEIAQLDFDACPGNSAQPTLAYSCVQGLTGTFGGIGNIGDDPLLADADGADDIAGTEDDDVSLTASSPCIDTGDPTAPLDPDGTPADMGAQFFDQGDPPPPPWTDLGQGLAGTLGAPTLTPTGGVNTAGDQSELTLTGAPPFNLAFLALGLSSINAPFKGGVFVPFPDILHPDTTDGLGERVFLIPWPANNTPVGLHVWCQWWLPDAGGPLGFAASNALEGVTQ